MDITDIADVLHLLSGSVTSTRVQRNREFGLGLPWRRALRGHVARIKVPDDVFAGRNGFKQNAIIIIYKESGQVFVKDLPTQQAWGRLV